MILFNIPNEEKLIETWHFFGLNTSRPVRVLFFYHRTKKKHYHVHSLSADFEVEF